MTSTLIRRVLEMKRYERLMRENPNRLGGDVSVEGHFYHPVGRTTRPEPPLAHEVKLTEEAEERLKQKMRDRSPSKITRRQVAPTTPIAKSLDQLIEQQKKEGYTVLKAKTIAAHLMED